MKIVGIDTGGTFTDFIVFEGGNLRVYKLPSTSKDPSIAICKGLKELGIERNYLIIHGTTVATNALLEGKVSKTLLVTNKGFEDVVEIGRQNRNRLYDLHYKRGKVPVESNMRVGINCRVNNKGEIIEDLREEDIKKVKEIIKERGAESAAVCFLHSYANPEHEIRVGKAIEEEGIPVSLSHEILNELREYERFITTVANASLLPIISVYIERIRSCVLDNIDIHIMHSNGGILPAKLAVKEPVKTVLSGPAGGVVGANFIAELAGYENIITFDMGGTSTDVSLIKKYPSFTMNVNIGPFPIRVPSIEIHTVGAGGGSIAYVDEGGALKVGPESVGADPGPACYGKGDKITVTDANLFLGRLIPEFFLGGNMELFPEKSKMLIGEFAKNLKLESQELAQGILKVANINMEKAVRVISVEKGYDPSKFTLVSFGGAGSMHAIYIAKALKIKRVMIPQNPGLLSALGLIVADFIRDYSSTIMFDIKEISDNTLESVFNLLEKRALEDLIDIKEKAENIFIERYLSMRYKGQSHELMIQFKHENIRKTFEDKYKRLYGYTIKDGDIEIVNARLRIIAYTKKPEMKTYPRYDTTKDALIFYRKVCFEEGQLKTPIYDRGKLNHGSYFEGPAIVVEYSSTTVVPPGYKVFVDKYRNLIVEIL